MNVSTSLISSMGFLTTFSSGSTTSLQVDNLAAGPAPDVTVNIQSTVQFRSLRGSVTTPSNHATINLVGSGTVLNLFQAVGSFAGNIAGAGSVAIMGASPSIVETFSGNNSYTGTTTTTGNSLRIDGTTTGQGNYLIAGANLLGAGTVGLSLNGTITLQDANSVPARLAPGTLGTIGKFSVITSGTGGVIFVGGSVLTIDVGAAGASDLLGIAGGSIDLTSGNSHLELNGLAGAFDGSTYTIASFDKNVGGAFEFVTGLPSNYAVTYLPNAIVLLPIPEPTVHALGAEALLLAFWLRRKKAAR